MSHQHEDLLLDGRNMPVRGRTVITGHDVVVGFRSNDCVSIYVDDDPVFQFNSARQLRRVHLDGQRLSAENGKLLILSRVAEQRRVGFDSAPLTDSARTAMFDLLLEWLDNIRDASQWEVANGTSATFRSQIQKWLESCPDPIQIADRPNAA